MTKSKICFNQSINQSGKFCLILLLVFSFSSCTFTVKNPTYIPTNSNSDVEPPSVVKYQSYYYGPSQEEPRELGPDYGYGQTFLGTYTEAEICGIKTKLENRTTFNRNICPEIYTKSHSHSGSYQFTETVTKAGSKKYEVQINGKVPEYEIVTFGDWPQSVKAKDVTVNENVCMVRGMHTYYLGSDGAWYYKTYAQNPWQESGLMARFRSVASMTYSNGEAVKKGIEYFKVEPIKWRVLTKNYNKTNKALLISDRYLTTNVAFYGHDMRTDPNASSSSLKHFIYNNSYEHSKVRAFLNGTSFISRSHKDRTYYYDMTFEKIGFLQTAFTTTAQNKINVTEVDNSLNSIVQFMSESAKYAEKNTFDKIFLISSKELLNAEYQFPTNKNFAGSTNPDTSIPNNDRDFLTLTNTRYFEGTDFAYSQHTGVYSVIWTRSPSDYNAAGLNAVATDRVGKLMDGGSAIMDNFGIAPCITIDCTW